MAHPSTFGRYQVRRVLGQGEMGTVYLADDPLIGRTVAIKALRVPRQSGDAALAEARSRFEREIRLAGTFSHTNIVTVHDVGLDEGDAFIAMEYVDGGSLQRLLDDEGSLSFDRAVALSEQLASALDYAHERYVVHRDVKPANILLTASGVPKIADFGVAHLTGSTITRQGVTYGSPAYMSPEQAAAQSVTGASDQFSLAVILYRVLTGELPFSGESVTAVVFRILKHDPVPPELINPLVPAAASEVLMRALSKNPMERFASCTELCAALHRTLTPDTESRAAGSSYDRRPGRAADRTGEFPALVVPDAYDTGVPARPPATTRVVDVAELDDGGMLPGDGVAERVGSGVLAGDAAAERIGSGAVAGVEPAAPSLATRVEPPSEAAASRRTGDAGRRPGGDTRWLAARLSALTLAGLLAVGALAWWPATDPAASGQRYEDGQTAVELDARLDETQQPEPDDAPDDAGPGRGTEPTPTPASASESGGAPRRAWVLVARGGVPSELAARAERATRVLADALASGADGIPTAVWNDATCLAVLPGVKKIGFLIAARYGKGLASCRLGDGWSRPSFVSITGGSVGFQVGAQSTDVVLAFVNREAAERLLDHEFTLGGDAAVAAGPMEKKAEASTRNAAAIYSYSRSRGLFAGVSLEGASLRPDEEAILATYGARVSPRELLFERHNVLAEELAPFVRALERHD